MNSDLSRQQAAITGKPPLDLEECVTGFVNAGARGLAQQVAHHDFTPLEFALLRVFLRQEECTTTQLAQILPVTSSLISRVVTKMVNRGLMRRRRLRNDRRIVMLTLTEEGKNLTLKLHQRVLAYVAMLFEGISEEETAVFASVTLKVMANYSALEESNLS